jgi:uncharacterized protein (DUF58 family)
MRFVFSRRFYVLLALGFIPLSISWNLPVLRSIVLAYDVLLAALAFIDYFISRGLPEELTVRREFERRFAIGDESTVKIRIENYSSRSFYFKIKDEFPPEMILNQSREAEFPVEAQTSAEFSYKLTPPGRGRYEFGKIAVRYFSKLGLVWCQAELGEAETVKVYPNMRRAHSRALIRNRALRRAKPPFAERRETNARRAL